MNIFFETEDTTIFAVAYNEIVGEYLHEEFLIAEIDPALGAVMVRYESDWNNPIHCDSVDQAKQEIIKNHYKYKPTSVRRNYYVG